MSISLSGPNPVPGMAPLERVNIAGINVMINPESMTYTISTRALAIETQGGVVYQLGPEKPVDLTWEGKTTKNSLGTVMTLKNIWRHQQRARDTVRYVNPMRGEDFEVIITSVSYTETWETPWRWSFRVSFLILGDLSDPQLANRDMSPSSMNLGRGDFNTARAIVNGGSMSVIIHHGDTFAGLAHEFYGSQAYAGVLRSHVTRNKPNAVSPTGEPVPGMSMDVPILNETNYEATSIADHYGRSQQTALDREASGKDMGTDAGGGFGGGGSGAVHTDGPGGGSSAGYDSFYGRGGSSGSSAG